MVKDIPWKLCVCKKDRFPERSFLIWRWLKVKRGYRPRLLARSVIDMLRSSVSNLSSIDGVFNTANDSVVRIVDVPITHTRVEDKALLSVTSKIGRGVFFIVEGLWTIWLHTRWSIYVDINESSRRMTVCKKHSVLQVMENNRLCSVTSSHQIFRKDVRRYRIESDQRRVHHDQDQGRVVDNSTLPVGTALDTSHRFNCSSHLPSEQQKSLLFDNVGPWKRQVYRVGGLLDWPLCVNTLVRSAIRLPDEINTYTFEPL